MAYRMRLNAPHNGMESLRNVSRSVGTQVTEANVATDVRLAKLLVAANLDAGPSATCVGSCRTKPMVNDLMDQSLGFWIYFAQVEARCPADGVISPAPKIFSLNYFICRMNLGLFMNNRALWEKLPDHPECGPILRAELTAPMK